MGGAGDHSSPICHRNLTEYDTVPAEEEEEKEMASTTTSECSSSRALPLAESPILFLICFHKALRLELDELRRLAAEAFETGLFDRNFVIDLLRRFEFLKLAYKYHCAAEDEVSWSLIDLFFLFLGLWVFGRCFLGSRLCEFFYYCLAGDFSSAG